MKKNILKFSFIISLLLILNYCWDLSHIYTNPIIIKKIFIFTICIPACYLLSTAIIILNYSIKSVNKEEIFIAKYLPSFIKKYLLNLKEIGEYRNFNHFVKLYFVAGFLILVMLFIFILIT